MTDLLAQFANPELMKTMSTGDKLFAGLFTTLLGMGITFAALIILQFVIGWMDRLLNTKKQAVLETHPEPVLPRTEPTVEPATDDTELIAAISASLALMLGTSSDCIVIKNIVKIEDNLPAWNRAGILEQMNSRL